jgi:hypothetical protein
VDFGDGDLLDVTFHPGTKEPRPWKEDLYISVLFSSSKKP